MEFDQIRYFLTVARLLHFTRAAEHCNVSQPALTKAIHKLEQGLGGPLFHRERSLTHLTELGRMVLPAFEAILTSADQARALARDYIRREIAPLVVGVAPPLSAVVLIDLLKQIVRALPGLQIEVAEAAGELLPSLLLDGAVNAAVVSGLDTLPPRIDRWHLLEERYVVLAPPNHALARYEAVPWQALKEAKWLARIDCDLAARLWQRCFGAAGGLKIAHRARQDSDLQYMAAAGLGVLLVPEHAPRLPSLVAIPIELDPLRQDVELLAVAGRRYSPALHALVKSVRAGASFKSSRDEDSEDDGRRCG